jgi:uncharacterized membrane protein (DUF373 family)
LIENLYRLLSETRAKKKAIGVIIGISVVAFILLLVFIEWITLLGILGSIAIIGGIGSGIYFWLKARDELPY